MKKLSAINKFLTFSFIICSTLCLVVPKTEAAQTKKADYILRVSPLIFNITLDPGKVYNYKIEVENLTSTPLPVKAYFENFTTTDEEGGYSFEDNTPNPLISWSSISKDELLIPAKSKESEELTVKIPSKVPFGGYYGVLFFEPLLSQNLSDSTVISAKIGTLLLANIGVSEKNSNGKILDFSTNSINQEESVPYLLRVQNNGLNHFSAKPILTIKPLFGKEQRIDLEEKFVFPGKVRRWEDSITLNDKWRGIYKATMSVSLGNGKQIVKQNYFLSFPISNSIIIVIIVSIFAFILTRRRRVKKALKILVKNK